MSERPDTDPLRRFVAAAYFHASDLYGSDDAETADLWRRIAETAERAWRMADPIPHR